MKKKFNIISVVIFLAVIFGAGAMMLIRPEKDFSENENRYLEKYPKFSMNELLKGKYIPKLEEAFNDQFPMRDELISLRSEVLRLSGNKDIGGAYLGDDGFLFEKVGDDDVLTERFERNIGTINKFAKSFDGDTSVMLIPSSSAVLGDKLPKYNSQYDAEKAFSKANELLEAGSFIDMREKLKALGDAAYYKTDHHWTTMAAREAYEEWCAEKGLNASDVTLEMLTESFRGTLYSKVLSDKCAYDTIYACGVPDGVSVEIDGKPSEMYDMTKLDTKDKYAVFFGGNFGRIDIKNEASDGGKLLIIKDSFANCFVPFVCENYSTVTMLDMRFFSGSVKAISKGYDSALFLFEISDFARDTNLVKVIM